MEERDAALPVSEKRKPSQKPWPRASLAGSRARGPPRRKRALSEQSKKQHPSEMREEREHHQGGEKQAGPALPSVRRRSPGFALYPGPQCRRGRSTRQEPRPSAPPGAGFASADLPCQRHASAREAGPAQPVLPHGVLRQDSCSERPLSY
ncbi:hypothetical protein CB1_001518006 [Camelus ferus]|nr:hypothetical protein CB1_001518006 [Camelus ferus]